MVREQIMIFSIIFAVFCASGEGTGVVKKVALSGKTLNMDLATVGRSKHRLTCGYQQHSPTNPSQTYTYSIECKESKKFVIGATQEENNKKTLNLLIKYDGKAIDSFEVTSCERDDVIKAVFPNKHRANLEKKNPVVFIKYKFVDDKCYARKYKFSKKFFSKQIEVTRFDAKEIDCEGAPGLATFGEIAEFTNCRVAQTEVAYIVKIPESWSPDYPTWTETDKERVKVLECSWSWFVKPFHLMCVKGDGEGEYLAVVRYEKLILQTFNVKTCDEDDIANGIFPGRQLEKRGDGLDEYDIFFAADDGKCYWRKYPQYSRGEKELEPPGEIPCPNYPDQWTNPMSGTTGQWYECHKFPKNPEKSP